MSRLRSCRVCAVYLEFQRAREVSGNNIRRHDSATSVVCGADTLPRGLNFDFRVEPGCSWRKKNQNQPQGGGQECRPHTLDAMLLHPWEASLFSPSISRSRSAPCC